MTTIKPVFMFCVPTSVLATITSSTIGTVPVFDKVQKVAQIEYGKKVDTACRSLVE